jgi:4-amino-4-deoxy-L-arabinose transferase-like glycosyltransferase
MAQTGQFVTPVLWGSAWFEKPPLLYWMTALATSIGLGPEMSGRLPVALLSLAFLGVTFWLVSKEFGPHAAAIATVALATSAAWITYSNLALTDLPLAVFFSLAVWMALPLVRRQSVNEPIATRLLLIGASLGLAILAKGLVPLALALPFFWFLRHSWRHWWIAFVALFAIALPWYVVVYLRNGSIFLQEFFVKHHFERLYSTSLQHVQPWYYYVPVLLFGLVPWTPLLPLLALGRTFSDERHRFLAAICAFGFLFFSLSLNKLPGYLLPLLPALFVWLGCVVAVRYDLQIRRFWLLPCAALIAVIPLLAHLLPEMLASGRFLLRVPAVTRAELFFMAAPFAVIVLARWSWVGMLLVLCVVLNGIYFKDVADPALDRSVSARTLSKDIAPVSDELCDGGTNRDWLYGLSFYRNMTIPVCGAGHFSYVLHSTGHAVPTVTAAK